MLLLRHAKCIFSCRLTQIDMLWEILDFPSTHSVAPRRTFCPFSQCQSLCPCPALKLSAIAEWRVKPCASPRRTPDSGASTWWKLLASRRWLEPGSTPSVAGSTAWECLWRQCSLTPWRRWRCVRWGPLAPGCRYSPRLSPCIWNRWSKSSGGPGRRWLQWRWLVPVNTGGSTGAGREQKRTWLVKCLDLNFLGHFMGKRRVGGCLTYDPCAVHSWTYVGLSQTLKQRWRHRIVWNVCECLVLRWR